MVHRSMPLSTKASFLLAPTLLVAGLFASERTIARSALPPAVEKTVAAETAGSTIKGFLTETENGKKVYEAETTLNGHSRDLQILADGTLAEVEEEVPLDSLAPAVQQGLKTKAGKAKILKVESLTKHGKLVAYEAATLRGPRHGEIQVGPDGGTLAHPE